jgi:hypothetical protein
VGGVHYGLLPLMNNVPCGEKFVRISAGRRLQQIGLFMMMKRDSHRARFMATCGTSTEAAREQSKRRGGEGAARESVMNGIWMRAAGRARRSSPVNFSIAAGGASRGESSTIP